LQPFIKAVDFFVPTGSRRLDSTERVRTRATKHTKKQQRHRRRLEQQDKGVFYPFI